MLSADTVNTVKFHLTSTAFNPPHGISLTNLECTKEELRTLVATMGSLRSAGNLPYEELSLLVESLELEPLPLKLEFMPDKRKATTGKMFTLDDSCRDIEQIKNQPKASTSVPVMSSFVAAIFPERRSEVRAQKLLDMKKRSEYRGCGNLGHSYRNLTECFDRDTYKNRTIGARKSKMSRIRTVTRVIVHNKTKAVRDKKTVG